MAHFLRLCENTLFTLEDAGAQFCVLGCISSTAPPCGTIVWEVLTAAQLECLIYQQLLPRTSVTLCAGLKWILSSASFITLNFPHDHVRKNHYLAAIRARNVQMQLYGQEETRHYCKKCMQVYLDANREGMFLSCHPSCFL